MNDKPKPIVIEMAEDPELTPETAVAVTDPVDGQTMQTVTKLAAYKPSWLARIFWSVTTSLIGLFVSVAIWDFVTGLLARNLLLGQIAGGLVVVLCIILAVVILRETAAFARLSRIDTLRARVKSAAISGVRADAIDVTKRLVRLYSGREDLRWARKAIADQLDDQIDGQDVLNLCERNIMQSLDKNAVSEIQSAARTVAAGTALIPLALIDVILALSANIRMVRKIAQIYGGRAGLAGSIRLLRAVATHLLATGAVAVGEDLVGSVVGGGALAKVSRRFGEGVINGALTARVGVAAMEVCRPMPFTTQEKPKITHVIKAALVGLFK